MTREEAIDILHQTPFWDRFIAEERAAMNMAIRSLKAWDKVWKDILNHEDVWGTDEILEVLDKHMGEVKE